MVFIDADQKRFFEHFITKTNSFKDPYRQSLFYALGLTEETHRHIDRIYNFEEQIINHEALDKPWQTGTSVRVTRLAFNLFNGFCGNDEPREYTPYELFGTELMPYMLEAVKLRYPEYNYALERGGNYHV